MFDIFIQFTLELVRPLLVDMLSRHVRRSLSRMFMPRTPDGRRVIVGLHRRTRKRLLHRLLTEIEQEL